MQSSIFVGVSAYEKALTAICSNFNIRTISNQGDIMVLNLEKYTVADVVSILDFASVKPTVLPQKICVIIGMDHMNEAAQNKLLKVIEDSAVCFVATAEKETQILATIKSRMPLIITDVTTKERQTVVKLFTGLSSRAELFTRMHLVEEKDKESIFLSIDPMAFFTEIRELFLETVLYCYKKQSGDEVHDTICSLYTTPELINVLEVCEEYMRLRQITKDDFFAFAMQLI